MDFSDHVVVGHEGVVEEDLCKGGILDQVVHGANGDAGLIEVGDERDPARVLQALLSCLRLESGEEAGNLLGGWISDRGAERDERWLAWVPTISGLGAMPFLLLFLLVSRLFSQAGHAFDIQPAAAALLPSLLFLGVAGVALRRVR